MEIILYVVSGFLGGGVLSYFLWDKAILGKKRKIIGEAEVEAEVIKKDKILQAKEKFLQLKAEHEKYINEKNNKINAVENKLKQKETVFLQRKEELQRRLKDFETEKKEVDVVRENLSVQMSVVQQKEEELDRLHKQQVEQLEAISGLSAEDAKSQLVESLKGEAKTEAMSYINEIMEEAKLTANKEAKKVVVKTIQRVATETAIET